MHKLLKAEANFELSISGRLFSRISAFQTSILTLMFDLCLLSLAFVISRCSFPGYYVLQTSSTTCLERLRGPHLTFFSKLQEYVPLLWNVRPMVNPVFTHQYEL